MYEGKISLTPKDILDKSFNKEPNGYRRQEVDKYLDTIIQDYNEFINMLKDYKKEINFLNEENTKLKNEVRRLKEAIEVAQDSASNNTQVNNVDMLRRLSQLEKVVFGEDSNK